VEQTTNEETTIPQAPEEEVKPAEKMVPLSVAEQYKNDMFKYKEKLRAIEEQSLREKEDWKTLAERREQERLEALERADRIESSFVNEKKFSAIERAALKAGIRPEAMSDLPMLNFDGVVVDKGEDGRVKVQGAEDFVHNLKQIKPHWFGSNPVKVNTNLPDVTSEKDVNESDLIKLSLEASKTGDYSKYKAAQARFHKQQRK